MQHHNNECRYADKSERHYKVAPRADGISVSPHILGDGDGSEALGELGRLQGDGTERNPRHGAFDIVGKERRGKQQHEHKTIQPIAQNIVGAFIYKQNNQAEQQCTKNPNELLTCAVGEGEDACLLKVVACTIDIYPPEESEQKEEEDGEPIKSGPYRVA